MRALRHWKWALQTLQNTPELVPWPVKTADDQWKPLLWQSDCLLKKPWMKKIRSCKTFEGPVKPEFFRYLPALWSSKCQKFFQCLALLVWFCLRCNSCALTGCFYCGKLVTIKNYLFIGVLLLGRVFVIGIIWYFMIGNQQRRLTALKVDLWNSSHKVLQITVTTTGSKTCCPGNGKISLWLCC